MNIDQGDDYGVSVNVWVNVVRRSRLHATTKLIALLMATYASPDGANIYPGVARLAVQSGKAYRTVQLELQRLRAVGLIEPMSRRGLRRGWSQPYRLILGPDALEKADVPMPSIEDAAVEALTARYRGKHRARSARNLDDVQTDDCTQWDGTTARNDQLAEQPECHRTLHVPLPDGKPPSDESDVRYLGTGSWNRSSRDDNDDFETVRMHAMARLDDWMREGHGRTGERDGETDGLPAPRASRAW